MKYIDLGVDMDANVKKCNKCLAKKCQKVPG